MILLFARPPGAAQARRTSATHARRAAAAIRSEPDCGIVGVCVTSRFPFVTPHTGAMQERDLIYDWNAVREDFDWAACRVELNDETLRDGLQCPSVTDPAIEDKKALVHLMVDLGIASADIGLPGA